MRIREQVDHLDSALLGAVVSQFPTPLTDRERIQINAFLVLAHAALEEYLESVFEAHFRRVSGWLFSDLVPVEAVRLAFAVAHYVPDKVAPYRSRDVAQTVRNAGLKAFKGSIGANNGLKADNVMNLAKLVGLNWNALENELNIELNDLDTLGVKRGAAGHLSPFTETVTAIAVTDGPDDVRRWVNDALSAVLAIERHLVTIVDLQQPQSLIQDWDGN